VKNSQIVSSKWYQVVIDGSLCPWGEGIWDLLERISQKICAKFGVVEHFEGQHKRGRIHGFMELEEMQWEPVEIEELLRMVASVGDIEWGDFYLFQQEPRRWDWDLSVDFHKLVEQSDTTLRVVDKHLFYVHTPSREVVNMLREAYGTVESIEFAELEFHSYPY
jgi:hypothetical protein